MQKLAEQEAQVSSKSKSSEALRKGIYMKSYNHLFEKLITNENLLEAVYNAAKHKRSRPDVREVLKNPQFYVDKLKSILVNRTYSPTSHKAVRIYDGSSKKIRLIIKPKFLFEQIIQHAVIQILKPIILKGMYPLFLRFNTRKRMSLW